jgi:hypothetical protein
LRIRTNPHTLQPENGVSLAYIMQLVFQFQRLSRIFRVTGADWTIGVGAAAGAAALLGGEHLLRGSGMRLTWADWVVVLWCGLSGFCGVRSWRRLWRRGRTASERFMYDLGVRGFGVIAILVAPVVAGSVIWRILHAVHDPAAWIAALVCAILSLIVTWPLALWLGFLWGSMMSRTGWQRDPAPGKGNGLPPPA